MMELFLLSLSFSLSFSLSLSLSFSLSLPSISLSLSPPPRLPLYHAHLIDAAASSALSGPCLHGCPPQNVEKNLLGRQTNFSLALSLSPCSPSLPLISPLTLSLSLCLLSRLFLTHSVSLSFSLSFSLLAFSLSPISPFLSLSFSPFSFSLPLPFLSLSLSHSQQARRIFDFDNFFTRFKSCLPPVVTEEILAKFARLLFSPAIFSRLVLLSPTDMYGDPFCFASSSRGRCLLIDHHFSIFPSFPLPYFLRELVWRRRGSTNRPTAF
jgi:hypothetical protein